MKKFDITVDSIESIKQENSAMGFLQQTQKHQHRMLKFNGKFVYLQTVDFSNQELVLTTIHGRAHNELGFPLTPHIARKIIYTAKKGHGAKQSAWSMSMDNDIVSSCPLSIDRFIEIGIA